MAIGPDWVIQDGSGWAGLEFSGQTRYLINNINSQHTNKLTSWQANPVAGNPFDEALLRIRYPESGGLDEVMGVRGFIHVTQLPFVSDAWSTFWGVTWWNQITIRIHVALEDPETGQPSIPASYDPVGTPSSNDSYVWQKELVMMNVAQNDWTGSPGARFGNHRTIPVVAKFKRFLRPPEILVYTIAWSEISNTDFNSVANANKLQYVPHLRTILRRG